MLGRENTGLVLGSGAVDAAFWALVCEDEEWLDAEFDAIVSAAGEAPARSTGRPGRIDTARDGLAVRGHRPTGFARPRRPGNRAGRRWRHERGPPRPQPASLSRAIDDGEGTVM